MLNSQKVIRININDISYVSPSTFITPSLPLILNQLMLLALSCSLNFSRYTFGRDPSVVLFNTLLFFPLHDAGRQQRGRIKEGGGREGGREWNKAFELGIYSIGHTPFTN